MSLNALPAFARTHVWRLLVAAPAPLTPPGSHAPGALAVPSGGILGGRGGAALITCLLLVACATPPLETAQPPPAPAPVITVAVPVPVPVSAEPAQASEVTAAAEPVVDAPVDPLRPEVPVDLTDRTAQIDLWQRVRNGFGIADRSEERR